MIPVVSLIPYRFRKNIPTCRGAENAVPGVFGSAGLKRWSGSSAYSAHVNLKLWEAEPTGGTPSTKWTNEST